MSSCIFPIFLLSFFFSDWCYQNRVFRVRLIKSKVSTINQKHFILCTTTFIKLQVNYSRTLSRICILIKRALPSWITCTPTSTGAQLQHNCNQTSTLGVTVTLKTMLFPVEIQNKSMSTNSSINDTCYPWEDYVETQVFCLFSHFLI